MKEQLSIVVKAQYYAMEDIYGLYDNTEDLDSYLSDGWKVVSVTPMGGGPGGKSGLEIFASLVILERG